jgi:predicted DNA-binding transcriptional regulator YafY
MKYTRVHRLLKLITLIQGSKGLNAKRLGELCDTTERNIYRDLNMLEGAGVPVWHDPESGGYLIRRDFFLRPVDLTLEEAMAMLILADRVGADEQISHMGEAGKAAAKLRAILPRQIAEMINESDAACRSLAGANVERAHCRRVRLHAQCDPLSSGGGM